MWLGHFGLSEDGRTGVFIILFPILIFQKRKIHSSIYGFDDELRALEASWLLCLEEHSALEDLRFKVI